MRLHGGIGDYTKDCIEDAHQEGRREGVIVATSNSKLEWAQTTNHYVKDKMVANKPKKKTKGVHIISCQCKYGWRLIPLIFLPSQN